MAANDTSLSPSTTDYELAYHCLGTGELCAVLQCATAGPLVIDLAKLSPLPAAAFGGDAPYTGTRELRVVQDQLLALFAA